MFENEWVKLLVDLAVNSAEYFGYASSVLATLSLVALKVPGKYPDVWFDAAAEWVKKHSSK